MGVVSERKESCQSCRFSFNDGGGPVCMRYPPAANPGTRDVAGFPTISSKWWCGEYKAASLPIMGGTIRVQLPKAET